MSEARDLSHFLRWDGGTARLELAVDGISCAGCMAKIEWPAAAGHFRLLRLMPAALTSDSSCLAKAGKPGAGPAAVPKSTSLSGDKDVAFRQHLQ